MLAKPVLAPKCPYSLYWALLISKSLPSHWPGQPL